MLYIKKDLINTTQIAEEYKKDIDPFF